MSGFQDAPSVAYYQVENLSAFDNEDEFFELCAEMNFEPFAHLESNTDSDKTAAMTAQTHLSRKRDIGFEHSERLAASEDVASPKVEEKRQRKRGLIAFENQAGVVPVVVSLPNVANTSKDELGASSLVVPSLPQDDIRMKFARMFLDALNQIEGPMTLDDFMNAHVTEDVFAFFKYVGTVPQDYLTPYVESIGRESYLKFWKAVLDAYPDSVYELHDTNIKVLMNGFTSITLKYTFSGTKALDLVMDGYASTVIITDNSKSDGKGGHCTYAFELEEGTNRVLDRPPAVNKMVIGIAANGVRLSVLGTMTFHVNPDKKIYKAEYLHCLKSRR